MPGSTQAWKQWEHDRVAEREATPTLTACLWCEQVGERWTYDATVGEGREQFKAHRLEQHPEVKPAPRKKRHRPGGQVNLAKSLDESIANVRAQGGATWEKASA